MLRIHPKVESTSEQAEDRLGGMARELQDVYDGRYMLVSSSRDQSILTINLATTPLISSRAAGLISFKQHFVNRYAALSILAPDLYPIRGVERAGSFLSQYRVPDISFMFRPYTG